MPNPPNAGAAELAALCPNPDGPNTFVELLIPVVIVFPGALVAGALLVVCPKPNHDGPSEGAAAVVLDAAGRPNENPGVAVEVPNMDG